MKNNFIKEIFKKYNPFSILNSPFFILNSSLSILNFPLKIFCITIILPTLLFSQTEPDKPKAKAVFMEFRTSGDEIPPKDLNYIQDSIREMIVREKIYELLEKKATEKRIQEKQEELKGCVEINCDVLIGKFTESSKVIDGKITREKEGYTVEIQLIDVEQEIVEYEDSFKIESLDSAEKNLDNPIRIKLQTYATTGKKIPEEKPKFPYVWRSTILPGWGQYYDERKITSYLYGTTFVTLSLLYYVKSLDTKHAESNYKKTLVFPATDTQDTILFNTFMLNHSKTPYKQSVSQLNIASGALIGFYVWNLFDAYYFSGKDPEEKTSFNLQLNVSRPMVYMDGSFKKEELYSLEYTIRF